MRRTRNPRLQFNSDTVCSAFFVCKNAKIPPLETAPFFTFKFFANFLIAVFSTLNTKA